MHRLSKSRQIFERVKAVVSGKGDNKDTRAGDAFAGLLASQVDSDANDAHDQQAAAQRT